MVYATNQAQNHHFLVKERSWRGMAKW